jgi:hypothetical protein
MDHLKKQAQQIVQEWNKRDNRNKISVSWVLKKLVENPDNLITNTPT